MLPVLVLPLPQCLGPHGDGDVSGSPTGHRELWGIAWALGDPLGMLVCQHWLGNMAQLFPAPACAKRLGAEGEDLTDQTAAKLQKKEAGTVKRIPVQ